MPDEYEPPIGQRPEITGSVVPPVPRHDPYTAFRSRGFRFFTTGNLLSILGRQMLAVAVEWEIYRRTHSATALGLVDRKSTRLNSSHTVISYAVFCLKKKKKTNTDKREQIKTKSTSISHTTVRYDYISFKLAIS